MKNLFYLWAVWCCIALSACSTNEEGNSLLPDIYMEKARMILATGDLDVKIKVDEPVATTVTVPFTLAGEAVEGTDFTLSSHEFVFQPGEDEAVVRLSRVAGSIGDTDKELLLNLDRKSVPQGYRIGLMNFTTVTLMSKNAVIVSFKKSTDVLNLKGMYGIMLGRVDGSAYRASEALQFELEVDPSSTAVEGENFEFPDGPFITIRKNKNSGSFNVNMLKKEAGKDKLVLRLKDKSGYAAGANSSIELSLAGPYVLNGTWVFKDISNKDWWETSWGEDISVFPKGTSEDQITFAGDSYKSYMFTPSLKGDLKNYFTEGGTVTWQEEVYKDYGEESVASDRVQYAVEVLSFDHINVNFSATHSKIRSAVVSFRITKDIDGEDILECTIDDFEPTDFLVNTYDMMKDYGETPVMLSCPLRLRFTRVK